MKKYSKLLAILLSALLIAVLAIPFVTAESKLLDGQKELYVKTVTAPPVQDGILNGHKLNDVTVDEYGAGGVPTFCITPEDLRAVDLDGNPLDVELPSYIYLYMAKDADALYVGMEIQEEAHAGDLYEFTTFLGFGDGEDADTMNSGAITTFKMDNGNSPNFDPGTWMDTQVTALSAQKVAADGTVTDTTANRKFNVPVEYMLPAWGSETTMNGKAATFFEAELDFEDAMLASGLEAGAELPEYAYFAFELGVFNGTEKIGKIVFNNDMTGKADAPDGAIKTVPHAVNLKTEFAPSDAGNATLSALSVEGGTLSPAFSSVETNYTLTLKNGVTQATVNATASAANASRVSIEGADDLGTVNSNNTITVTCRAQNGYTRIYTLNVVFTYDNTDFYVDASGNDETGNGSKSAPFATIEKALQAVAAREWEVSEMATIHINGTFTATAPDYVLFGAKTVFTKAATRLPITIQGDSKTGDVIKAPTGNYACSNSYHFDTLTFTIDENKDSKLYAGSGEVRFDNVNWTTLDSGKVSRSQTIFCGDSFTAKVFDGWTETEIAKAKSMSKNGAIEVSVTIGENANYHISGSAPWTVSVIGDSSGWISTDGITVKSSEVSVAVILDGSTISRAAIYGVNTTGNSTTYAKASFIMNDGKVHIIQGDTNSSSTCTTNADVLIAIYGGTGFVDKTDSSGSYMRNGYNDVVNGDLTFTVESGNWWLIEGGWGSRAAVSGDFEMNVGGTATIGDTKTENSGVYTGGQNSDASAFGGSITYNVYGNAYISYYRLHGTVNVDKIVNNVSGGTIYSFKGAHNSSTIKLLENNISGGTFVSRFNGAGLVDSKVAINKVVNNISGGVFNKLSSEDDAFRGTSYGNIPVVENNISGGTFTGTYQGTYNSKTKETYTNISGGTFEKGCYISYFELKETDLVKTTITGGTFKSTFLGSYGGKIGKVETTISGGSFLGANYVYLGPGSTTWPSVVDTIENTITGGNFEMRVYGGGQGCHVTTGITNNIVGGSFSAFYGGISAPYYSSTTKNMIGATVESVTAAENSPYCKKGVEGKIVNNFGKEGATGPSFSSYVMGGSLNSTHKTDSRCTIENNIYSGTFKGTYYGGGDSNNATITSITNNFKGGTFNGSIAGGSYSTDVVTVTNNIEEGTFNACFFGGSRRGNVSGDVINNVKGGTFNKLFFGGSDHNSSSATADTAPTTYTIEGSIKNTFTGGVFKTGASGAGFGTVKGNVENTIKGDPNFQLGFYGVQATLMDTVVEGNVLNLVTKDESGVAPTFPKKNAPIDYSYDNSACTLVFCTDGSNIGFAATGASGTVYTDSTKGTKAPSDTSFTLVKGYVETIIEAGTFNGHYYAGGGLDITGANEDGYGVINIVRGDPVFNYSWAGGCISSTREAAYKTYNEIDGGTYNDVFSSFNRTATSGTYTNACEVVTLIKSGTFNSRVQLAQPWSDSHGNQHQRTAPYTITIAGGTFNGDVYGLYYRADSASQSTVVTGGYLKEGGDVTINVNGGTFAKNIYAAGTPYPVDSFKANAVINIAPTKGDVTILGDVAYRFDKEKVNLLGGEYKLILGADASVAATSASGDVKIGQGAAWKKQTYVTMPEGNTASITVTGAHCLDKIGESVVAVKGGVQLAGATMILTDRVAVRALFDKASVDSNADFTFSFTMNGQTLAEGTKADLEIYEKDSSYYSIVLAKISANDFTSTVTFAGSDLVWGNEFSIESLAVLAETAWEGNDEGVALAKAMQNFASIVANPTAELPHKDLAPEAVVYEQKAPTRDEGTNFIVNGKGLVMSNAVGIRIYGTATTAIADTLTVTVNGTDVTDKAVIAAGANEGEYTIDLYVNAKNMSDELHIVITEKATGKTCLDLTDRVDAIAASYGDQNALAQQLLVYIQAAVAYAKA